MLKLPRRPKKPATGTDLILYMFMLFYFTHEKTIFSQTFEGVSLVPLHTDSRSWAAHQINLDTPHSLQIRGVNKSFKALKKNLKHWKALQKTPLKIQIHKLVYIIPIYLLHRHLHEWMEEGTWEPTSKRRLNWQTTLGGQTLIWSREDPVFFKRSD